MEHGAHPLLETRMVPLDCQPPQPRKADSGSTLPTRQETSGQCWLSRQPSGAGRGRRTSPGHAATPPREPVTRHPKGARTPRRDRSCSTGAQPRAERGLRRSLSDRGRPLGGPLFLRPCQTLLSAVNRGLSVTAVRGSRTEEGMAVAPASPYGRHFQRPAALHATDTSPHPVRPDLSLGGRTSRGMGT